MTRRTLWVVGVVVVAIGAAVAASWAISRQAPLESLQSAPAERSEAEIRQALFDAVQPVNVTNCEFTRFGEAHDGGYLMCGNLLKEVKAGYSYGIDGYDGWGCQISNTLKVPVHQYDCFNTTLPACEADTKFHAECVGPSAATIEGRVFDTIEGHLAKNGDTGKHIVLKVDIEGAEWDSFLHTPDAVLANVDQIAVEFHRINQEKFIRVIEGLKRTFYVAHLHFNNASCEAGLDPFPAWALEVLLVNKRIATVDLSVPAVALHPLDTPSAPGVPDCQGVR
jgi:hypothetical protein